jgi:hypothetical protein
MAEYRNRIEVSECVSVISRYDPTPKPYSLHIRERFNDDGTVDVIHRKRVYSNILGGGFIIDDIDE